MHLSGVEDGFAQPTEQPAGLSLFVRCVLQDSAGWLRDLSPPACEIEYLCLLR